MVKQSKKEIYNDIKFCKDLMDRLLIEANSYKDSHVYDDKHTVLQSDIIRLRRELNTVRKKLDWNYGIITSLGNED